MGFKTLIITLLLSMDVFTAADGVKVNRAAPEVEHKRFDRKNPPADMPTLEPGEAAVTRSSFLISTQTAIETVSEENRAGKTVAKIKFTEIIIDLSLKNSIWLPKDATKIIVDHEEGHRQLNDYFYKDAEKIAREIAQKYIARTYEAEGSDGSAAATAAMQKAINEMSQQYMAQVQSPAVRANQIFDELTDHSRNQRISVEKAMKDSIERAKKEKK